jgi:Crp-like helix-turn-helix domain
VEKRLARWLLMLQDRVETDVILITQAFLAEMLGSRRAIVTLAAGALQRIGLIEYQRRRVHILDRERLENAGWDCYPVIRKLSMQSAAVPATSLVATASHQSAQSHGDFV